MSLLNSILGSALGAAGNSNNTQMVVSMLGQVLSGTSSAPGAPSNGLAGVLQKFEQAGLGNMVNSWVGSGPNQTPTPDQVHQGLGPEVIQHIADKTGLPAQEITSIAAQVLPHLIDHATPNGTVPAASDIEGMLGGLLGKLGQS